MPPPERCRKKDHGKEGRTKRARKLQQNANERTKKKLSTGHTAGSITNEKSRPERSLRPRREAAQTETIKET